MPYLIELTVAMLMYQKKVWTQEKLLFLLSMLSFCLPMHNSKSDSYSLELNTYIATQNKRFVHPWHQSLKNTKSVGRLRVTKKGKQVKKKRRREDTFQPSSSSKQDVCNKPSIFWSWHHGCENFGF